MLEGLFEWKKFRKKILKKSSYTIGRRISPVLTENSEQKVIFKADLSYVSKFTVGFL